MSRPLIQDDEYPLFLHLDDEGQVWTCRSGGRVPSRTRLEVWEYIDSAKLTGVIRVTGGYENASLVSALLQHAKYNPDIQVQLGSPRLAPGGFGTQDTLHALASAPAYPASLGGWRKSVASDVVSYQLADYARDAKKPVPLDLVHSHPLWSMAQFVPTISAEWFGRFVGNVLDPRWYINRDKPDRHAALYAYLGLRPQTFSECLDGQLTGRHFSCWTVYWCWMPQTPEEARLVDMRDPRNFLFRVFGCHVARSRAVAAVRSSQILVSYLRDVWIDLLTQGGAHGPLFSPDQFFVRPEEQQAFRDFTKSQ